MNPKFKIVGLFQINGQSYIVTEYLDDMVFRVETNFLLGDFPVHNFCSSLNRLNNDGTPKEEHIFHLKNRSDINKAVIGQEVELRKQPINKNWIEPEH